MNIFKSFGIYAGGQAVNAGIRFLLIPYYSYLLSVSDFGKVGMVWMFVPILTMLIGMGATASVSLKYYKIENELRENLLNFAFVATFVLFLCIGTVVFFAHPVLEQMFLLDVSRTDYMKLVCAAYGAFLIEFILGWFKIRIEPQRFVLFNTLYTLISIGFLLFFLAVLGRGFLGFIDGTMYGNLTMALLLVLVYVSSCKAFQIQLPSGVVMDLIHLSAPIVVGFAVSYVMTYSGRYVLAQVSTMEDVGIYVSKYEYDCGIRYGMPEKKMKVLYTGIPDITAAVAQKSVRFSDDVINILFVGRFDRQKGLDFLLDVFRKNKLPHLHLNIIGAPVISTETNDYYDDEQISFLGWVQNSQIGEYYRAADAVIMPSRWEGFSIVALEAMRYGKAILASDRTSLPEQVKDGVNGHLFSLDDEMQLTKILQNLSSEKLVAMGKRAREMYCERFTEAWMLDDILSVYRHSFG